MQSKERRESSSGVRIFSAPSRSSVLEELKSWTKETKKRHPETVRIGLFGSYAKNTHVPGSDIDLLAIVAHSPEERWFMRPFSFDTSALSVGADLFVYTSEEAERMKAGNTWFQNILQDTIWL